MTARWNWRIAMAGGAVLVLLGGCRAIGEHYANSRLGHAADSLASQASFLRWNMSSTCSPSDRLNGSSRALELASRSKFELDCLMSSKPAPDVSILHGKWNGINKGIGAAAIGLTQDVKVFVTENDCLHGHNQAVYQVALDDLCQRGFKPKLDPKTCQPQTMGNFVIVPPCSPCKPLVLDYTRAENSPTDPSRWLVDELVIIDHDLLLGKAHMKLGERLIPVAYFVLSRPESCACDESPFAPRK